MAKTAPPHRLPACPQGSSSPRHPPGGWHTLSTGCPSVMWSMQAFSGSVSSFTKSSVISSPFLRAFWALQSHRQCLNCSQVAESFTARSSPGKEWKSMFLKTFCLKLMILLTFPRSRAPRLYKHPQHHPKRFSASRILSVGFPTRTQNQAVKPSRATSASSAAKRESNQHEENCLDSATCINL